MTIETRSEWDAQTLAKKARHIASRKLAGFAVVAVVVEGGGSTRQRNGFTGW